VDLDHFRSGLVCAGIPNPDGSFNTVNIYGANNCFGENGPITRQAFQFQYVWLTPIRVLGIPYAKALDAFEHDAI
jgi:CRP-like cAMP-binding protein